ncbi:hypothetical protein PVAND_001352 [Polypedilum vanderplanki]|uniref:Uncharacterized protein n=1 Tax=Polypedilum vanderplanki TaxID=319348 RepID=A0A9J6BNZ7_POLVA|nr:hypothetical protein PVAND_001352 [Polypedilum vanderplanki]
MAVAILLLLLSTFNFSDSKSVLDYIIRHYNHLDLKLVHVFFRHGFRTPADTYPNDIYVNETFEPYGWGQLTNRGKQQMYVLGQFLRSRYKNFLNKTLDLNEIYAQSTGVSRTKMSLQLVLASLYPPKNTELEWNTKLNWQPIPYNYEELNQDSLLLVRKPCPKYQEELNRVMQNDISDELKRNTNLFNELTNITGLKIKTPDDVQSLYSTLKAEKEFGLVLPKWTLDYFPKRLQEMTDKSYVYNAYNSELKRLKGGVFVKKALGDWKSKIDNKISQKIFVYAGHDSTVTNILSAFNVWKPQFPDYGITGILELSQNKKTKQYGIEIFLKNSNKFELTPLTIPGCSNFCELSRVEELLKENIPNDWNAECQSNFTVPLQGGP